MHGLTNRSGGGFPPKLDVYSAVHTQLHKSRSPQMSEKTGISFHLNSFALGWVRKGSATVLFQSLESRKIDSEKNKATNNARSSDFLV